MRAQYVEENDVPNNSSPAPAPASAAVASGNGCGTDLTDFLIPDRVLGVDLTPACNAHDQCYSPGSTVAREVCDVNLAIDIRDACVAEGYNESFCEALGDVYLVGVMLFGGPAYRGDVAVVPLLESISDFHSFR